MGEQNLKALAVTLKRGGETDEQAFERLTKSDDVVTFKHDVRIGFGASQSTPPPARRTGNGASGNRTGQAAGAAKQCGLPTCRTADRREGPPR